MADTRIPGPVGNETANMCVDDGTMVRWKSPTPGPVGIVSVEQMSLRDRFVEVLRRTTPLLPGHMHQEFAQLLSPINLLVVAGTLSVWAGSHYFGVGFIVDGLLLVGGAVMLGWQVLTAASDFVSALKTTYTAKSSSDLTTAAEQLARFVAVVGVAVFTALIFKGLKRVAPKARGAVSGATVGRAGGLPPLHFRIFQSVAQQENRIIAVRNTNPLSTPWIERGFPPKPMEIKIKTSKTTGIVTALGDAEAATARSKGFYVVDADGVPRNALGHELKMPTKPEWPLEPGQVVHPIQQRPLVGDYDLLGVINPEAKGRNIVLAASDGKVLNDWSSPEVRRIAEALNSRMDQPRIMHGAHDGFFDLPDTGGSVVFFPDGSISQLNTAEEVAEFYKSIGRQTIRGSY